MTLENWDGKFPQGGGKIWREVSKQPQSRKRAADGYDPLRHTLAGGDTYEERAASADGLPIDDASTDNSCQVGGVDSICAADVMQERVEWIKSGSYAIGKLTLLGGDPGMGKSQLASDDEARITRAMLWPGGGRAPSGSVVILSSEDGAADTIVPRLDLAGADLKRVHIVRAVFDNGKSRTFSLQNDLERLGKLIAKIGDVALVRIDPITSYMGSDIDSHRTTDVRAVLEPVANFAAEMKVGILAITHPPKAS